MQTMLVTLEDSLLDLRERDAGDGVVDVVVVLGKVEKSRRGGAEIVLSEERVRCRGLFLVLEQLLRIKRLGPYGEGPRPAD